MNALWKWPTMAKALERRGFAEKKGILEELRLFGESHAGAFMLELITDAHTREYETLRTDLQIPADPAALDRARQVNARLDVIETLLERGFGAAEKLEASVRPKAKAKTP